MQEKLIQKSILYGSLACGLLLGVYFAVLTLVSGWAFAQVQFSQFWYFIVSLAAGFGVQIGLYAYLRNLIKGMHGGGKVLGVTGTTSSAAMISCCAQYQVELFWIGLLFNLGGIYYMANKVIKFSAKGGSASRSGSEDPSGSRTTG